MLKVSLFEILNFHMKPNEMSWSRLWGKNVHNFF